MNFEKMLDELAQKLSDKAAEKLTPLQESIDAFKALTAYYAAKRKPAKKQEDEDPPEDGGFTFGNNLGGSQHDGAGTKVRARRTS